MLDLVLFIICSFATYRLSLMFSKELGPCRIFERFRALFKEGGCWHKGVTCIFCETVWWAGLITLWMFVCGAVSWEFSLIYWLGVSGLAVVISEKGPNLD